MLAKTSVFVCVVLGATLSTARADTEPEADSGAAPHAATSDEGNDQLTLPKGRLLLDAFVEVSLTSGAAFKPFSISPDLWYGVTDDLTVGLVHSSVGTSGVMGGVGTSLCLAGTSGNCSDVYKNVGADVRYKLKNGKLAYAVDGGLFAIATNPFALAVKLGLAARWEGGKLAVELQPNVLIGVTQRSAANGETISIPVTAFYTVAPSISVSAQLAPIVPFDDTSNAYQVALSVGGNYSVNESLHLLLAFSLPRIVAGSASGADVRSLTLGGIYAF